MKRQATVSRKALAEAIWRDDDPWFAEMLRRVEYWREAYLASELYQEKVEPFIEAVDAAIKERGDPPPQIIELQKALKDVRRRLKKFLKTKPKADG